MKITARFILIILLGGLFITSCKKSVPKQVRFIPKNASTVAIINVPSFQEKLKNSEATLESILKNFSGNNDTSMASGKAEWEDLKNSGVDFKENVYIWFRQQPGNKIENALSAGNVTAAIAGLNDERKLKNYLSKKYGDLNIQKGKNFQYITHDGSQMIAWGKDVVMSMWYQQPYTGGMVFDSATGAYNLDSPAEANSINELKAEMAILFSQDESASVASIPEFRELALSKSDAGLWVNSSSTLQSFPLPLPKLKELTQNNYVAANLNFEEGKIKVDAKSYSGKGLNQILKKYPSPSADLNLVERFPSDSINGFMVFAFDPQIVYGIVQYLEVGAMADGVLTKFMGEPFKLQDALKAIKGDVALVFSNVSQTAADTSPGNRTYSVPTAKVIVNMPVGDKTQMDKLMDKLVEMNFVIKSNGEYRPKGTLPGFTMLVNDKNVFIASDNEVISAYNNNQAKAKLNPGIQQMAKDQPALMFLDIQAITASLSKNQTNKPDEMVTIIHETFNQAQGFVNHKNGDFTESHFELSFMNQKQNSLVSLINFASKASEIAQKNRTMQSKQEEVSALFPLSNSK